MKARQSLILGLSLAVLASGIRKDGGALKAQAREFFNNPGQPHKPARVTVTTPTYGAPGTTSTMLEVEFVAAFPKAPALSTALRCARPERAAVRFPPESP